MIHHSQASYDYLNQGDAHHDQKHKVSSSNLQLNVTVSRKNNIKLVLENKFYTDTLYYELEKSGKNTVSQVPANFES